VGLNEKHTIILLLFSCVFDKISAFPQLFFSRFILSFHSTVPSEMTCRHFTVLPD